MFKSLKIIIISGPTASGKTALAIDLAQKIDGAIISADSMQVYRGLDIGTAKISRQAMGGIPHYLLDIVPPNVAYNVANFQKAARAAITEIAAKKQTPIVVGGSGLYIQSLVYDYVFDTIESLNYQRYEDVSTQTLAKTLQRLDPKTYQHINLHNRRRVMHAVALAEQTDMTKSQRDVQGENAPLYDFLPLALMPERTQLYDRINQRAEAMIAAGLVAEVAFFSQKFSLAPQIEQAIGYRETLRYLAGEYTNKEAYVASLAQDTRRFAKRQITWLKNQRIQYHLIDAANALSLVETLVRHFLQK